VSKYRKEDDLHTIPVARSPLTQFEPGGSSGPIEDANEYEALIQAVPDPEHRELLEEASRFATTWQYLSTVGMELPAEIAAEIVELKDRTLSVRDRITRMRDVNQRLMEFISRHDREDSPVRQ
jgi:hypothetical protein